MRAMVASALLVSIVELGEQVLCKPHTSFLTQGERLDELAEQLALEIKEDGTGVARYLDNFAPVLVQAIRGALKQRRIGSVESAESWESVVGSLIPKVRRDAGLALETLREKERS